MWMDLIKSLECLNGTKRPWASLVVQTVKNLPATGETWVRYLGQEDPLDKEMATHSSILAGEFHGQRSLAGHSSWDRKELNMAE